MRKRISWPAIFVLIAAIFLSCKQDAVPPVEAIDEAGFQQLLQQRNGKILFLNVWATWCLPCREEFPALIKLAETYKDSNVEIVGISADFPDEVDSKILPFLQEQQANFKNYVRNFSDDEAFINTINPEWSGALPVTVIYDPEGNQKVFHLGEGDFQTFQEQIESVR